MPYVPSSGDVHINTPLTNISIAFMQMAESFVAHRVFRELPVGKQADTYYVYPRGAFMRDQVEKRAPGAESVAINYSVEAATPYFADVWAAHVDIADQDRANTDGPLDPDMDATELLTQQGMIRREKAWADDHLKTGVWTFGAHGATSPSASFDPSDTANDDVHYWNNASSDPIELIRALKRAIQRSTGRRPNVLTLGRDAYDILLDHGDIVGRIDRGQTDGPAIATREALAALFELEEVLVMDAVVNSGDEGADDSIDFIAGKHGLLSYRPPRAGLRVPAAGYTFEWTGYMESVMGGAEMSRWREQRLRSDRVEIEMAWDQKSDLGGPRLFAARNRHVGRSSMAREIRKVRHWKQKWDPDAPMIWRRRVLWGDRYYEPGEPVPDDLAANRKKLRRFWESSWIERADFVPPDELRRQAAEAEAEAAGAADSDESAKSPSDEAPV